MIKNILGALLLALLVTACGKTGEETSNTTVQDSTAADAEAKRKAQEEKLAREKAEAERVAREEAERIEQARLVAEGQRASLNVELKKISGALIEPKNLNIQVLNQYKLSLENLLTQFRLLNDETSIAITNDNLGKVKRLIAIRTPKKGATPKQVALEDVKRIIEASRDGQATLQDLRGLNDTIKTYKDEAEFSGIEAEIKAAEKDMLIQGQVKIEEYLKQLGDKIAFDATKFDVAKKEFLKGNSEIARAKEVLRLENLIALTDEKIADELARVPANQLFDMFVRMLIIEKGISRIYSIEKPKSGAMSRAKTSISFLAEVAKLMNGWIVGKNNFDKDLMTNVKQHFRDQINGILSDDQYFKEAEFNHIKKNADAFTKGFFGW